MFLAKRSSGVYYLYYFDELGKRHKVSTGKHVKAEALKFLQEFRASEHERKTQLHRTTLALFAEDYLRYSKTVHRIKSQESARTALREFLRIIGNPPLHRIGVREIERFVGVKKSETSLQTARTYFVTLASAFETAKRWKLLETNPFRSVAKPKTLEQFPAFFSRAEIERLLAVMTNGDLRDLCVCAVLTGMRLSELTSLEWTDIDFGRGLLYVRNKETFSTKTGKNRTVPINRTVVEVLASRRESAGSELVFHYEGRRMTKDYVSKGFKRYVRRAGLNERLHFHSLRHTFASWLVQDGASLYEVQKLLGHSDASMTQVYSHLQPEIMHRTVERIAIGLAETNLHDGNDRTRR